MKYVLLQQVVKLNKARKQKKGWQKVVSALAVIVVFCTTYALILPAITMGREPSCGYEIHEHTESCYGKQVLQVSQGDTITQDVLICEIPEHAHEELCYVEEMSDGQERYLCGVGLHTHNEGCYDGQETLICNIPEHMHEAGCLVNGLDLDADIETEGQWEATFSDVGLTGKWSEDILAIAKTQLGYHESALNCILDEKEELRGYTRYGAWYDNPYGEWDTMFVMFCMHYAGVEGVPVDAECGEWIMALEQEAIYHVADTYSPKAGDIIFFDTANAIKQKVCVGIVAEWIPATETASAQIKVIAGDSNNQVEYITYKVTDSAILGYGEMPLGNVLKYQGADFEVIATYNKEANIPADAQLEVREILAGTGEYDKYYQQSVETLLEESVAETEEELNVSFARYFDINFIVNGQKVEPSGSVDLQICYSEPIVIEEEDEGVAVHFAQDGIEVLEAEVSQGEQNQTNTFTFTQDSFSVTGTMVTYAARATRYTTVSTNSLDSSGGTRYVVYTKYGNSYYALSGVQNAAPVPITVEDGVITSDVNNNILWTFTSNGTASTYVIKNVGTGRYMHSFYNSQRDYGITTSGDWASTLVVGGDGKDITFSVKSNDNYSYVANTSSMGITQNASVASQYYIATLPQGTYHVWFDGTNGDLMSLYGSDNTYQSVRADNNTITLPSTWKSPSKYAYKLNGWYDIVSHTYYPAGAQATITQHTVFYADWVAATYDVGQDNEHVVDSLDTNDFITTYVFDYNSLFNAQSLTHVGSISSASHSEVWSVVQNGTVPYNEEKTLDFSFIDWDTDGAHISYANNRNDYNNNRSQITDGVIEHVAEVSGGKKLLDLLFDPNTDVMGKNYVGTGNHLYQYMDATTSNYDGHDGYYYFHSKLNAASYNQSEERFYLYDYLERTSDSEKDGGPGEYSDFLPFNSIYANHNGKAINTYYDENGTLGYQFDAKDNGQGSATNNAGTNYWFGMRSDVEFFLPNDAGVTDSYGNYGNISTKGHHMIFEFHGDDDLWVFVDGELMLDVGGIHGVRYGQIDFSTGTVTSGEDNNAVTKTFQEVLGHNVPEGTHTMTVYYMERGGSQSNCSIYFNVAPRYDLEIRKEDIYTAEALDGTEFTIYVDEACKTPAQLWVSSEAHEEDMEDGKVDDAISTITVVDGVAKCWGISAGKTYYIRETKSPDGYPPTDDMIRITLNNRGTAKIETTNLHGSDGFATEGYAVIEQDVNDTLKLVCLLVTNQTDQDTTKVRVQKAWDEDSVNLPEYITVYLTVNGERVGRTAQLYEGNGWAYTWTGLPKFEADGITEIEYEVEEVLVSGYQTTQEASIKVVDRVDWIKTDAMEDSITYLLVNGGRALAYDGSKFTWTDIESAKNDVSAQWFVTTNHYGFRLTNGQGNSITYNALSNAFTASNMSNEYLNQVIYYADGRLLAQQDDVYHQFGEGGASVSSDGMIFTLYRKEVLTGRLVDIKNTPVKEEEQTFLEVNKIWGDTENHSDDSVTIHLYADGKDTGRTVILNKGNGWKGSFEGLPYYQEDGVTPVGYTVLEDEPENYDASYSAPIKVGGKEFTVWRSANALERNGCYRFVFGANALSCDTSNQVIVKANDITDTYQQWKAVASGSNYKLQNIGTGRYLYLNGSTVGTTTSLNSASNVVLSDDILRLGTSYYVQFLSGSVAVTQYSNNATTFTVSKQTTVTGQDGTSFTVINSSAEYALPETGGTVNHIYTFGLLLVAAALMYTCRLEYKQRKEGK